MSAGVQSSIAPATTEDVDAQLLMFKRQIFTLENNMADLIAHNQALRKDLVTLGEAFEALLSEYVEEATPAINHASVRTASPADAFFAYDDGLTKQPVAPSIDDDADDISAAAPSSAPRPRNPRPKKYEANSFFDTKWAFGEDLRAIRDNTNWQYIGITAGITLALVMLVWFYRLIAG